MTEIVATAFDARVHFALIASPGDTSTYRDRAERAIWDWNAKRSQDTGIVFLPRRYERDAVPLMSGQDGQAVINEQLVRDAAVVIGLFHLRLGGKTPRAASGTVEELEVVAKAGGHVHVYFSREPVDPTNIDNRQWKAVEKFKKNFPGLYADFQDVTELETKIQTALDLDAKRLKVLGQESASNPSFSSVSKGPVPATSPQPVVRVAPVGTSLPLSATVDMTGRIDEFAKQYTDELISAVPTPEDERSSAATYAAPQTIQELLVNRESFAELFRSMPKTNQDIRVREDRSRDEYERQVDEYGVELRRWAHEALGIVEARSGPVFVPELENLSEQWYADARLRLTFDQPVRIIEHDDGSDDDFIPDIPTGPRPWGPRRSSVPGTVLNTPVPHWLMPNSSTLTKLGPRLTIRSSANSTVVTYPEIDLHAGDATDDFAPVVLLIPEGVERVNVEWLVTTSNQKGRATGSFVINVMGDPFDSFNALSAIYQRREVEDA